MLDFRKLFFASAVVALASTSAFAQPLSCTAQASATTSVRAEGIAELTGDVLITCSGGTPTAAGKLIPQFNLQVFAQPSVEITSRILGNGKHTEAVMFIDEPAPANQTICGGGTAPLSDLNIAICNQNSGTGILGLSPYDGTLNRPNAWLGERYPTGVNGLSSNSLIWRGIQFDPPGTVGSRTIRIKNIRVNASLLGATLGNPAPITLFISTSPSNSSAGGYTPQPITVPIANQQPTIGLAQVTHKFGYGAGVSALVCEPGNPNPLTINWEELLPNAWKSRSQAGTINDTAAASPVSSDILQNFYDTETGFYKASGNGTAWPTSLGSAFGNALIAGNNPSAGVIANGPVLGLADSGTRFILRLTNIPSQVSANIVSKVTDIKSGASVTGHGAMTTSDGNGYGNWVSPGSTSLSISSGSASAVWEVLYADTASFETFSPQIQFTWSVNNPPAVGSSINGRGWYAPSNQVSAMSPYAGGTSSSTGIPRFLDNSVVGGVILTVNSCRSNLLFPFVTNKAGLDTGFAISNTSRDPFGTAPQSGACTLYYYGQVGANNYYAPSPQPVAANAGNTILGGDHVVWSLSSGGGAPALAGFQGYLIARCDFQYAHGFAFISDFGAQKLAMGYLALIFEGSDGPIAPRVTDKYEDFNN